MYWIDNFVFTEWEGTAPRTFVKFLFSQGGRRWKTILFCEFNSYETFFPFTNRGGVWMRKVFCSSRLVIDGWYTTSFGMLKAECNFKSSLQVGLGRKLFFAPGIWTILDTNLSPSFELFPGDKAGIHTDASCSWSLGQQIYWFPSFSSTAIDSS